MDGETFGMGRRRFRILKIVVNTTQGCPTPDPETDPVVCDGGGFNRITLTEDPSDGFENVVITYKYSEYKFTASATPIRLAGTRFFHGGATRLCQCQYPGQHRHRWVRQHNAH